MNVIYQGTTWRRTVEITDDLGNPVDPTDLSAVLCPGTDITVTRVSPGLYDLVLTEAETAVLLSGATEWQFFGRIGPDLIPLVIERTLIESTCVGV